MKCNFKYIITKTGAILFNENTTHSKVAKSMEVYSAGFCNIKFTVEEIKIICHGRSESLELDAQPEIDKIIIGDLFDPVSKIKYFGMSVKAFYK